MSTLQRTLRLLTKQTIAGARIEYSKDIFFASWRQYRDPQFVHNIRTNNIFKPWAYPFPLHHCVCSSYIEALNTIYVFVLCTVPRSLTQYRFKRKLNCSFQAIHTYNAHVAPLCCLAITFVTKRNRVVGETIQHT